MEQLSESRDDEQRVVDPDAEPDHRHQDLGDRVEVRDPGGEEEQEERGGHRDDGEDERDRRGHERPEQDDQDEEARDEADDVARTLLGRWALGIAGELDLSN